MCLMLCPPTVYRIQPSLRFISFIPISLNDRCFREESLPELWKALPRMKTIAQPFDRAEQVAPLLCSSAPPPLNSSLLTKLTSTLLPVEQEALLAGRASLLLAEATWGEKAADVSVDYLQYRLVVHVYLIDDMTRPVHPSQ